LRSQSQAWHAQGVGILQVGVSSVRTSTAGINGLGTSMAGINGLGTSMAGINGLGISSATVRSLGTSMAGINGLGISTGTVRSLGTSKDAVRTIRMGCFRNDGGRQLLAPQPYPRNPLCGYLLIVLIRIRCVENDRSGQLLSRHPFNPLCRLQRLQQVGQLSGWLLPVVRLLGRLKHRLTPC
jgi:hypothetical protein